MKRKKCYIYTRVSTAAQTDGYSLEAQQEKLRKFAEYRHLEIAGEYCDAGKSGHSIKGRPSFMEMLDNIVRGKDEVSYVLAFKLSRFGRNAADILKSVQLLMDYEVDLVCVEDAIDSSTQGGRLTLAILSAVAEIERENICVQFMSGKMQKAREGGWPGGPVPYGYRITAEGLAAVPEEEKIIQMIYQMYLSQDMKIVAIASWLNDHGYTESSRKGKRPFSSYFVKRILQSPLYCGMICYNRRQNSGQADLHQRDIVRVRGKHEAFVSEEIWKGVQKKLQTSGGKNEKTEDTERISLLSGLVKCPVCGCGMVARKDRTRNKNAGGYYKPLYYYVCRKHRKPDGRACSFSHAYNQKKLDAAVLEMIGKVSSTDEFRKAFAQMIGNRPAADTLKAEGKSLRKRLHSLEHRKYRLGNEMDHLDVFSDDYEAEYERIQNQMDGIYGQMEKLQEELDACGKKLDVLQKGVESTDSMQLILDHFDRLFAFMGYEERRELCRQLIQSIEVFPEEREDRRILKSILFRIPLFLDLGDPDGNRDPEDAVMFRMDCTAFAPTVSEAKATYKQIKEQVLERTGLKVSGLYIAQIKRKYGIEMGQNYNIAKDPSARVPKCPKEKELAILEALKAFRMLPPDTEYREELKAS